MFISIAILDSAEVFAAAVLNASASAKMRPEKQPWSCQPHRLQPAYRGRDAVTALDIGIKRSQTHCNYVVTQEILGAAVDIVNQTNLLTEIQCFGIGKIALGIR